MDFKNNLIIKKIFLDLDEVKDLNVYPFNIESIKNFKEINFDKNYPKELTFYLKKDCLKSSKITITLKDKYYNLPIQKGNIIL